MSQDAPVKKTLKPRSQPSQKRSVARHEQILEVSADLLEKLGTNGLTTIRIAKELGISVGTLYHYYPNKEAILHAMGQRWLEQMAQTLSTLSSDAEQPSIDEFIVQFVDSMIALYRSQKGLLHLVQGMFAIPQLMPLDERHDRTVIDFVAEQLLTFGYKQMESERERIGRSFHETSHALLLVVVNQNEQRGSATRLELIALLSQLLKMNQLA